MSEGSDEILNESDSRYIDLLNPSDSIYNNTLSTDSSDSVDLLEVNLELEFFIEKIRTEQLEQLNAIEDIIDNSVAELFSGSNVIELIVVEHINSTNDDSDDEMATSSGIHPPPVLHRRHFCTRPRRMDRIIQGLGHIQRTFRGPDTRRFGSSYEGQCGSVLPQVSGCPEGHSRTF